MFFNTVRISASLDQAFKSSLEAYRISGGFELENNRDVRGISIIKQSIGFFARQHYEDPDNFSDNQRCIQEIEYNSILTSLKNSPNCALTQLGDTQTNLGRGC